jgi:glycosyltransferase involved in cell wall biosynthesis
MVKLNMLNLHNNAQLGFKEHRKKSVPRIMLFDINCGGHHSIYIEHLINYWCQNQISGKLDIVVSQNLLERLFPITEMNYGQSNINFVVINPKEEAVLKSMDSFANRIMRSFQEWHLICKYARSLGTNHCLIMWFDPIILRFALGIKPPCSFSGICFRTIFHYQDFDNSLPEGKEILWHWRDKLLLPRIFKNRHLKRLFLLDPFAVKRLQESYRGKVLHLPDPVQVPNYSKLQPDQLRKSLRIEPNRKVFLLFGSLIRRKGIYELLEAISLLPCNLCQQLCLVLSGVPWSVEEKQLIESNIKALCQSKPVQIISNYEFISEQDVQTYYSLADVILAPYQRHVGMSGILLLAAAAEKPVLSSNYGLMGELVKRYQLGLTVNSTIPSEIARGMTQFLQKSPPEFCNIDSMKKFAKQNTPEKFSSTIFNNILSTLPNP